MTLSEMNQGPKILEPNNNEKWTNIKLFLLLTKSGQSWTKVLLPFDAFSYALSEDNNRFWHNLGDFRPMHHFKVQMAHLGL